MTATRRFYPTLLPRLLTIALFVIAVAALAPPAAAIDECTLAACLECAPGFYCCEQDGACWDPVKQPTNCNFTKCRGSEGCQEVEVCQVPAKKPGPKPCKPTLSGDRTLTFVNNCPATVGHIRVGYNGGYVQDCPEIGGCPAGTVCFEGREPPGCFWAMPEMEALGSKRVLAPGAPPLTITLENPPHTYKPKGLPPMTVKWSGNVYASTFCDANGDGCETALCPNPGQPPPAAVFCQTGQGPVAPATLAEFTFSYDGEDYYDISQVNGFNVPIAMQAVPPKTSSQAADAGNPYWCQTPGSTTASGSLQGCSWEFDTQVDGTERAAALRWVTDPTGSDLPKPGYGARKVEPSGCPTGDCPEGTVCGLVGDPGTGNVINQMCGQQRGWWNAFEVCSYNKGASGRGIFGTPYYCASLTDLYLCTGANAASCYQTGSAGKDNCCGCPRWVINGTELPISPDFTGPNDGCYSFNPAWHQEAEPWARFNKAACPTSYSFPFDDATSTFTCATAGASCATPNVMGYEITFCPGGKVGF